MKQDKFLSRNAISFIKAAAIILMLTHHLLGFADYWAAENTPHFFSVAGYCPEMILARFGKICVAMFAFCTGYCIYNSKEKYFKFSYCLSKIIKLLLSYWVIEAFILALAVILKEPLPSIPKLLLNLIGMYCGIGVGYEYANSSFAWYVGFYVRFMIVCPLLLRYLKSNKLIISIIKLGVFMLVFFVAGVFCDGMIRNIFFSFSSYGGILLIGYIVSQFGIFDFISNKMHKIKLRKVIDLAVLIIVFLARTIISDFHTYTLDMFYIVPFIFALVDLCGSIIDKRIPQKIIKILSVNSMNLWLLHSIFFMPNRTIQFIAYFPHFSLLIVLWSLIILIMLSVLISYPQKWANKLFDKFWLMFNTNSKSPYRKS